VTSIILRGLKIRLDRIFREVLIIVVFTLLTDRQTDRRQIKHNCLGGGHNTASFIDLFGFSEGRNVDVACMKP